MSLIVLVRSVEWPWIILEYSTVIGSRMH